MVNGIYAWHPCGADVAPKITVFSDGPDAAKRRILACKTLPVDVRAVCEETPFMPTLDLSYDDWYAGQQLKS